MQIFVTGATSTGTPVSLALEVEASDSIFRLRAKIQAKLGIAPIHQLLTYGESKLIYCDLTVSDYNIAPGATLDLRQSLLRPEPMQTPHFSGGEIITDPNQRRLGKFGTPTRAGLTSTKPPQSRLEKGSNIYRTSIEHLSNIYSNVYRTSCENL